MGRTISFANPLIVSCQDNPGWSIPQVLDAGAGGLRVEGPKAVKLALDLGCVVPIVACRKIGSGRVYITPNPYSAGELLQAGADIVAFDATDAPKRETPVATMIKAIHETGGLAMADIETLHEGCRADELGADFVSTTLSPTLSHGLIRALANSCKSAKIVAEGHIRSPRDAQLSMDHGASLVVVGSAITRPREITEWYVEALT